MNRRAFLRALGAAPAAYFLAKYGVPGKPDAAGALDELGLAGDMTWANIQQAWYQVELVLQNTFDGLMTTAQLSTQDGGVSFNIQEGKVVEGITVKSVKPGYVQPVIFGQREIG